MNGTRMTLSGGYRHALYPTAVVMAVARRRMKGRSMQTSCMMLILFLLVNSAGARYSGGTGTAEDPYQIATAAELIALGDAPEDYDKHFVLTADIDLDPNLPGRKVFDRAIIAPDTNLSTLLYEGTPFTGVFDGGGHTLANLTIIGGQYLALFGWTDSSAQIRRLYLTSVAIDGTGSFVGGLVGRNEHAHVLAAHSSGRIRGDSNVGGLVGCNSYGSVVACHSHASVSGFGWGAGGLVGINYQDVASSCSTGAVSGTASGVGGLVGDNEGSVTSCFATGSVSGRYYVAGLSGDNEGTILASYSRGSAIGADFYVGGLVGENQGSIAACYSSGWVWGASKVGGLVGTAGWESVVDRSFWDIDTSGQTTSPGGCGLTTAQMRTRRTFLDAGWDLVENSAAAETAWTIAEDRDYPRLVWECRTLCPASREGAVVFVDKNLEAAVENELCVCRPTAGDMLSLVELSNSGWLCPKAKIADLTGIEHAVNLRTLSLPFHEVRFLSPLWGMTNLESLDLRGCPVRDLSPLSVLRRLSWLNLHKTAVRDISPLVGLTSLAFVDLRGTLLDLEAYEVHIPRLRAENPELTILYDPYR